MKIARVLPNRLGLYAMPAVLALQLMWSVACGSGEPAGRVMFIEPSHGDQMESEFLVKMGVAGLILEPAGEVREGHGHHHLLIDTEIPALDQPIPKNHPKHLHLGKAETEVMVKLGPGEHTLTLLFADGDHVPLEPAVSKTIRLTVAE